MRLVGLTCRRFFFVAVIVLMPASAFPSNESEVTDWNNRAVVEAKSEKFEEAIASLRHALALNPDDVTAKKNLSGILIDYAQKQAGKAPADQLVKWLEEAVSLDSKNGPAWVQLGDLYAFRQSDWKNGVRAWRQALPIAPQPVSRLLADRIARAERDMLIERQFEAVRTEHFSVKVQGGRSLQLNDLTKLLEQAYARLNSELGAGPESLDVIVYTEQQLKRVGGKRDWTIGFYDGRIRLRGDELAASLLPDLVVHELAHAFLHRLYGYRLPVWLHEGFAQSHESELAASLRPKKIDDSLQARTGWIPLKWLDKRFQQPADNEDLLRAYAESRLVVRNLLDRYTIQAMVVFMKRLSDGQEIEPAFDAAFAPWRWSRVGQGIFD